MRSSILLLALVAVPVLAQNDAATWSAGLIPNYRVTPNITYLVSNNYEAKLDVYARAAYGYGSAGARLLSMAADGSAARKSPSSSTSCLGSKMGWNVVSVEYRLGRVSLAPAAVEGCLCATLDRCERDQIRLRSIADRHERPVGGWSPSVDDWHDPRKRWTRRECPGVPLPKVAGIVNFYGITDVNDLLDGANRKTYAVWLSSLLNRDEIARRVSSLLMCGRSCLRF
jgi:hypothetical protein